MGFRIHRGTSLKRNSNLPRIAIGPYAEAYCRFLERVGFLSARYPCIGVRVAWGSAAAPAAPACLEVGVSGLQGYLAHKKLPPP